MRGKRWPAALGAVAGLVMIVAGVAGLLASCSTQLPQQPPRGQHTVPTPTASLTTGPGSPSAATSPASPSVSPGVLKSFYPQSGGNGGSSPATLPVSLTIPVIGVKTSLLKLGLVTQASLACPADPTRDILHRGDLNTCPLDADPAAAGWYTGSPPPGATGPAIIAGHINFNGPAVFGRLGELRDGDRVYVILADRSEVVFRVTATVVTKKTAFSAVAGSVYGLTGDPELRLISCSDDNGFDSVTGHYYDNIIVYATEVT